MTPCRRCGAETPSPRVLRVTITRVYQAIEEEESETRTLRLCDECAKATESDLREIVTREAVTT